MQVDDAPKPSSIHDDDDGFVYPSCGPTIFSLLPTAKMPNIQNLVASCAKHASTAVRKVKKARTRSVAKEHLPDAGTVPIDGMERSNVLVTCSVNMLS